MVDLKKDAWHGEPSVWLMFDHYQTAEIVNAVSAYISNTPADLITKQKLEEIGGGHVTKLVINGKQIFP